MLWLPLIETHLWEKGVRTKEKLSRITRLTKRPYSRSEVSNLDRVICLDRRALKYLQ